MAVSELQQQWNSVRTPVASRVSHLLWLLVAIIIVVGAVTGVRRALHGRPDWQPLYTDVRYVWQHGHTAPGTTMFGYLPTTTFALLPFMAWLPLPVGATLYALTNVIAAGASAWIVWRYWPRPAETTMLWPVLLASVNFANAIQANQLTLWTLLLCVSGLTLVERRRGLAGGVVLGLAVALKTMPAMLLGYCLLRRRWRAAGGMVLGVVVFDVLPSIAYFGWRGTGDEHRAWLQRSAWHSNELQITDPLLRANQHKSNFSYSSVLARWLRAAPAGSCQVKIRGSAPAEVVETTRAALEPGQVLTLDPMPPHDGGWNIDRRDLSWMPRFHVADWSPTAVLATWGATLACGFIALAWITWRSPQTGAHWTALAAIWMLAMFWPSPMARHYYLSWAFPALAVVCGAVESRRRGGSGGHSPGTRLAIAALVSWVVGVICLGWPLVRWYGLHLGALALLIAGTAWAWRRMLCEHRTRSEKRGGHTHPPTNTPTNGSMSNTFTVPFPSTSAVRQSQAGNAAR